MSIYPLRTLTVLLLLAGACGGDQSCDLLRPTESCEGGLVCEDVVGAPRCAAPVVVQGLVHDLAGGPIADARVIAVDLTGASIARAVTTDRLGVYSLRVPVPRFADGSPVSRAVFLNVSAFGFREFPFGQPGSPPIELSSGVLEGALVVVRSKQTDVALTTVSSTAGLGEDPSSDEFVAEVGASD